MTKNENVTIRVNTLEKAELAELSRRLQRNQSDVVRLLVRESLAALKAQEPPQQLQTNQVPGTTRRA